MTIYNINDETVQEAIYHYVERNFNDFLLECIHNIDFDLIDYATMYFKDFQRFCYSEYGFQVTL